MDMFDNIKRWAGEAISSNEPAEVAIRALQASSEVPQRPNIPQSVERLHDVFSTTQIADRSGGAIDPLTRQGASGLAGNYVVETGDPTLSQTDVIEEKARAGRGMAQYTHARRGPYDAARDIHIAAGGDPNDIEFQIDYAAQEYAGKYDPAPGKSLVGYTRSLNGETDGMSAGEAATHLRKDFFRPRVPHNDRRVAAAEQIDKAIQQRNERLAGLSTNSNFKNSSHAHVGHRAVDGRYWAGDDYGWQSPESFKKLIGY